MRMHWTLAALLSTCSAATVRSTNLVTHERRDAHSMADWELLGRAASDEVLPIKIALRESNLDKAEQYILDVSDPKSENFGKHWTAEEVANTFLPSKETNDAVIDWLHESGINTERLSHSTGRNWIKFDATVAEAEALFDTQYNHFKHSGKTHIGCDEYKLPQYLTEHIDFVLPTIHLGSAQKYVGKGSMIDLTAPLPTFTGLSGTKNCDEIITIECLRAIYDFPAGTKHHPGNEQGIGEWDQYLDYPDLKVYFEKLTKPTIPSDTCPDYVSIDGGKKVYGDINNITQRENFVLESAIDFQTSYAIIYPQNTRWYSVGDGVNVNSVGTFNILLDALDGSYCHYEGGDSAKYDPHYPDPKKGGYKGPLQCGGAPVSPVISISYGQEEVNLSPFYEQRQCHEYMKLGLQGVSVVFASGDSGVAQRYNSGFPNKCLDAHSNKKSVNGTRFSPGFPQTCPYVTSVGATDLLTKSIYGGEKAVDDYDAQDPDMSFYSGGGFSNVFKLPSYQANAVNHYLNNYPTGYSKDQFNQTGSRAYPDVSALGIQIAIVFNGTIYNIGGGTSASAPIFASIVTLLNEERLAIGKKPLGFLNPTLYANPGAFNDVTVGSNPGCGTEGFKAQPGWDPVTGLGTPNFQKLKKIFVSLP